LNKLPILVLVAMPLVMAALGREWLYTPIGFLDPWYMVGYFMYYHDPAFLADHYKLQRLPWILSGWALYQLLGAAVANFVLHIGALIASTVLVYLTLARLVAREAAFIAAALLTVCIPFHGSGGWDYQTAGAAAFYAAAFYFMTCAAQAADPRRSLAYAGAAFAAACFSTIHLVNFLPVLVGLYLAVGERHRGWRGSSLALRYGLLGAGALTALLCLINVVVGRGPFFFWPLLKIVFERLADPTGQKPWLLSLSALFDPPSGFLYLIPLLAVLAVSLVRLALVGAVARLGPVRGFLIGQYVFVALLWVAWQAAGHTALWPDYFAHVLFVPAFLAIGGLAGGTPQQDTRLPTAWLAGGGLLAIVPAVAGMAASPLQGMAEAVAATAVAVGAVAVLASLSWGKSFAPAVTCLVAAVSTFIYAQVAHAGPTYWRSEPCVSRERAYLAIIDMYRAFRSENPLLWQTWVWLGPRGERTFEQGCQFDVQALRRSVHSTGVSSLGHHLGDRSPQEIPEQQIRHVTNGGLIAVMVQHDMDADGLAERFAASGRKLTLIRREVIDLGRVRVVLLLYRSRPA
jgi:hypothetical protein